MAFQYDLGILPLLMQFPSLFHSVLVEVVSTSPFAEQSFSLSVTSQADTLFSEYPLLFSVATPADKHLAGHPNGHTPTCSQTHIYTDIVGMHTHAHLLHPPPGELKPLQLFSGLGNKSSNRASNVSSLIGTSTDNVAAAKEEFKSPGEDCCTGGRRRSQMLQVVYSDQKGRNTSWASFTRSTLPHFLLTATYWYFKAQLKYHLFLQLFLTSWLSHPLCPFDTCLIRCLIFPQNPWGSDF